MNTRDAYNDWAKTYDTMPNKTRDLEAKAIRQTLENAAYGHILEIGCGTGKNTMWLAAISRQLTAVDFSAEMLRLADTGINPEKVKFRLADITREWNFEKANLVSCSLVLEHIQNISFIFQQAACILEPPGQFYLCELHPYKQLQGSRAKFEKEGTLLEPEYFIHHLSEYFQAAKHNGFTCDDLKEWFDNDDRNQPPRLVSFLFTKNNVSVRE